MSVDVIIRQKGLFRKTLALQPVTGGELRYGKYNSGWRLEDLKFTLPWQRTFECDSRFKIVG